MMNLNESIECLEMRMADPKKSLESRARELSYLHHLNDYRAITEGKTKYCYRYGKWMVEQCEVCGDCLTPERLQWNEGE